MSARIGNRAPWLARIGLALSLLFVLLVGGGGLAYYASSLSARVESSPTNLYIALMSKTPVLNDKLDSNKASIWETYARDQSSCVFKEGALHIMMESAQDLSIPTTSSSACFLHNTTLHNFAFQIHMTIVRGDQLLAGMLFRSDKTGQDNYRLYLDFYNNCNFMTEGSGKPIGATFSVAMPKTKKSATHILAVIAQNSTFYLYLDTRYIGTVTDSLYPTGSIGLFTTRDSLAGTDVTFNSAEVWKL